MSGFTEQGLIKRLFVLSGMRPFEEPIFINMMMEHDGSGGEAPFQTAKKGMRGREK